MQTCACSDMLHCACVKLVRRGGHYLHSDSEQKAKQFVLEHVVHGHCIYRATWTLSAGEILAVYEMTTCHNYIGVCTNWYIVSEGVFICQTVRYLYK